MDCKRDSDGCPADGAPVYWKTGCIGISFQHNLTQNLDPEETRKSLERAFQAWSEVDCGGGKRASITFAMLDDVSCRKTEYRQGRSNVNVVFFQDDDWQYKDVDNTLAKTTLTFDSTTGEIFDADIEINTSANKVTLGTKGATYDLQSIVTHEVGHFIGLAHSPHSDATMYASYEPGTLDLRTLSDDDIAAVCTVYPPGRDAKCDSTPQGGLGKTCDGSCNALDPPSIMTLVLAGFLRRRRGTVRSSHSSGGVHREQ